MLGTQSGLKPASHRQLPGVMLLFLGSGCAALIYEIVWFQVKPFCVRMDEFWSMAAMIVSVDPTGGD